MSVLACSRVRKTYQISMAGGTERECEVPPEYPGLGTLPVASILARTLLLFA